MSPSSPSSKRNAVAMVAAAGVGIVVWQLLGGRAARRTRYGIVVWQLSQLPAGWADLFAKQAWDFVSIKVCDGRRQFKPDDVFAMVRELRQRGVAVHGWGFHYCRTVEAAVAEARVAAHVCNHYGLSDYHWNAEKHWSGSDDRVRAAVAFAREFHRLAPQTLLWANCYSGPMTREILRSCGVRPCFDVWEPMMYGTRASTIDRHTRRRLNKFGGAGEAQVPRAMMVGTGKTDSEGQTWGFFNDRGAVPGLLTLVQREQPYAVSYWRAPSNLLTGNAENPSVAEQLRVMQAATGRREVA